MIRCPPSSVALNGFIGEWPVFITKLALFNVIHDYLSVSYPDPLYELTFDYDCGGQNLNVVLETVRNIPRDVKPTLIGAFASCDGHEFDLDTMS